MFHLVGRRDILIGCAGSFRMLNLMQHVSGIFPPENELATDDIDMSYLVTEFTPVIKAITEDFDEDDPWEMLIAVGSRIYRMQIDLSILEPTDNCDAFGGRDHTTVLHACRKIAELSETDADIREDYKNLLRTLTT